MPSTIYYPGNFPHGIHAEQAPATAKAKTTKGASETLPMALGRKGEGDDGLGVGLEDERELPAVGRLLQHPHHPVPEPHRHRRLICHPAQLFSGSAKA
eukprot:2417294-Rhodomonas_salina.5